MKKILLIIAAASMILLIAGCQAGTTKEQRLDAFIADMESGTAENPPDPREHFRGHPNASKINSGTFTTTDMDPGDELDITGYAINGDTFTMTYTTKTYNEETINTASFYSESNDFGGEDWYIKSMTVPLSDGFKLIPDDI
ncbi:MAG: hypothetical protein DRZ90_07235 [Spirochaetes bacterium]|nr:MAG: hypothetical protein DRZ90_07235 [Spirochaetota bacterium]